MLGVSCPAGLVERLRPGIGLENFAVAARLTRANESPRADSCRPSVGAIDGAARSCHDPPLRNLLNE